MEEHFAAHPVPPRGPGAPASVEVLATLPPDAARSESVALEWLLRCERELIPVEDGNQLDCW